MKTSPILVEISASPNLTPLLEDSQFIPVIAYFTQNAEERPDHVSLIDAEKEYSYRTLNILANRLAHRILALRGEGEEPVLFLIGREAASVVAILGIWKAGKFFIGLDPAHSMDRLVTIVAAAKAGLLVTNQANLTLAGQLSQDKLDIINLDEIAPSVSAENPAVSVQLDTLAAVFYTSGSTGEPKGIVNDHRSLAFRYVNHVKFSRHDAADRFMLPYSFAFGASSGALCEAFVSGGTLCLCDPNSMTVKEIAQWLLDHKITVAGMMSSLFGKFLDTLPEDFSVKFPNIRFMQTGGEALDIRHLENWKKRFSPNCILEFALGSTEAGSIAGIDYDFQSVGSRSQTMAVRPWVKIFIVDDSGTPLAMNQIGRIAVRSKGTMRGYWARPDLNETIFVKDPEEPGKSILLLQDLGRLHGDGNLEFIGRGDAMIKLRGFRIEPGEIESALRKHAAVSSAAVAGKPNPKAGDELSLVAYISLKPGSVVSAVKLREFLLSHVSDYMVPANFVFLEQIPLNQSGKIDRRSLPEPDWAASPSGSEYVAPHTEIEKNLVILWQELLGKEKIGIQDNFFMLGGHSLTAFQLMAEVDAKLGRKLPLQTLISHPTVAALAKVIGDSKATSKHRSVVVLREDGQFPALFMVPAGGTHALSLLMIVSLLKVPCKVYGLEYPGMDGYLEPFDRMEKLASFFAEQIRAVQPEGPYYLGGQCAGNAVAFETARQLEAQGQKIGLVAVLDGRYPDQTLARRKSRSLVDRLTNRVWRAKSRPRRDMHSLRVTENLRIARVNYTPSPLNGRGLAIFSDDSMGLDRETAWGGLFSEFKCLYVPNTTHGTIFSEEHRQEVARLLSENIY